jgi:hypothetical protein
MQKLAILGLQFFLCLLAFSGHPADAADAAAKPGSTPEEKYPAQSCEFMEHYLSLFPQDYGVRLKLGLMLINQGQASLAIKHLALIPADDLTYGYRAQAALRPLELNSWRNLIATQICDSKGLVCHGCDSGRDFSIASTPVGRALDGNGNTYLSDFWRNRITKISKDGKISTFCESADLSGPSGLVFDSHGNLFVANTRGKSLQASDYLKTCAP